MPEPTPATPSPAGFFVPTKWWQWVLIYPALATTVFQGMPTVVDKISAAFHGVPYDMTNTGKQQDAFWTKNGKCVYTNPYTSLAKTATSEIGATFCPSGDVVIKRTTANAEAMDVRFVSMEAAENTASTTRHDDLSKLFPIAAAYAQVPVIPRPEGQSTFVCQRKIDNKTLLTRLKFPSGCIDEKVNTYTGQVIERTNAECSPTC